MSGQANFPRGIVLLAMDVDGVLTDGCFYLSDEGVESKAFNTQDGYGIRRLLESGVQVAVISGRASAAVELRMEELGVKHVFLACKDKVGAFDRLLAGLEIDRARTVYIGDDIPDLPLLNHAGFAVTVANAVDEVREASDYVTRAAGGSGAVREVCDLVLAANGGRAEAE